MWRCLNDILAYCAGDPLRTMVDEEYSYTGFGGHLHKGVINRYHCELDPKTCGLYLTYAEHYSEFLKKTVPTP